MKGTQNQLRSLIFFSMSGSDDVAPPPDAPPPRPALLSHGELFRPCTTVGEVVERLTSPHGAVTFFPLNSLRHEPALPAAATPQVVVRGDIDALVVGGPALPWQPVAEKAAAAFSLLARVPKAQMQLFCRPAPKGASVKTLKLCVGQRLSGELMLRLQFGTEPACEAWRKWFAGSERRGQPGQTWAHALARAIKGQNSARMELASVSRHGAGNRELWHSEAGMAHTVIAAIQEALREQAEAVTPLDFRWDYSVSIGERLETPNAVHAAVLGLLGADCVLGENEYVEFDAGNQSITLCWTRG